MQGVRVESHSARGESENQSMYTRGESCKQQRLRHRPYTSTRRGIEPRASRSCSLELLSGGARHVLPAWPLKLTN